MATVPRTLQDHVGIDRAHGLIRTWQVTHAAAHDGGQLEELLDAGNTASGVWADTAYRSAANLAILAKRIMVPICNGRSRGESRCRPMSVAATPPAARSGPRSSMSSPARSSACVWSSARSASPRAKTKLGLANLAYNLLRFTWLESRAVPA